MTSRLASLLDREQDRIAVSWAAALSRMRPSAFVYRPLEELRRLGRSYLTELIGYLDTDDPSRLREFIHREAALRLSMGFGAAEVVQGFLAFRDLAQGLCGEIATDPEDRMTLLRGLTEATDFTVVEFVTQFQRLAEERAAVQAQELEQLQRALVDQAVQDALTDMFTARVFDEHLTVEVKRAARYRRAFALIVCDIDRFEAFRGRYGQQAAEEALRSIAGLLRELTRDVDVKARTDETEFSLALPETSLSSAFVVAERVRGEVADARLAAGVLGDEGKGELTLSVGVGAHPDHGATARELMQAVRAARDRARLLGGDLVIQAEADAAAVG
ncbi:MAG: GGDEF domain-containing protein [Armatimonadota bacterium]|nr:GGDEF domain-containing protein [Armatimonadota bacterium]